MRKIVPFLLCLNASVGLAQQHELFTHYTFNMLSYNPGYAGGRDVLSATALHRSQWVSFPGAPITQAFTIHAPVANNRLGIGISALNEEIGPNQRTIATADVAYRLPLGNGHLSFGLKGGIELISQKLTEVETTSQQDDANFSQNRSGTSPRVGAGIYYSTPYFYAGVSSPSLLNSSEKEQDELTVGITNERHYYLIAGGVVPMGEALRLRPSVLFGLVRSSPINFDASALLYIKDLVWVGPFFRLFKNTPQLGAMVGINVTDQLALGYSYDRARLGDRSGGYYDSHEVMLRYEFIFKKKGRIRSPRYF